MIMMHLPPKLGRCRVDPSTDNRGVSLIIFQLGLSLGWQTLIVHTTEGVYTTSRVRAGFEQDGEPLPPELVDGTLDYMVFCHCSWCFGKTCTVQRCVRGLAIHICSRFYYRSCGDATPPQHATRKFVVHGSPLRLVHLQFSVVCGE